MNRFLHGVYSTDEEWDEAYKKALKYEKIKILLYLIISSAIIWFVFLSGMV